MRRAENKENGTGQGERDRKAKVIGRKEDGKERKAMRKIKVTSQQVGQGK